MSIAHCLMLQTALVSKADQNGQGHDNLKSDLFLSCQREQENRREADYLQEQLITLGKDNTSLRMKFVSEQMATNSLSDQCRHASADYMLTQAARGWKRTAVALPTICP